MDYLPWIDDRNDDGLACITDRFEAIGKNDFRILKEESIHTWWPDEVIFDLSPDYGVKLVDYIPNVLGLHIISEKLKNILNDECGESFDFYPVKIRNQKGRLVNKPYYLAHLRVIIAAMDYDKSDFRLSHINPERASRIRRIILDEKKIPKNTKVFALKEDSSLWLIRRDLGVKIYREYDCRGMLFIMLDSYGEEWR